MTHTEIGYSVDVQELAASGVEYQLAKELAQDILQGSTSDYLFFCSGRDSSSSSETVSQYLLLLGDCEIDIQNRYVSSSSTVYQIYIVCDTSGASPVYNTIYYKYDRDLVRVSSQVPLVVYSSMSGYPHLVSGGEYYAFTALCVLCVCIVFRLLYHIWHHVL